MPPTPLDTKPMIALVKAVTNRVIPQPAELRKLTESGYVYMGAALLRVRTRWTVDRDGALKVGGGFNIKANLAELAKVAAAGGIPAADIAAKVEAAWNRVTASDGDGIFEVMLLPLVVPKDQAEAAARLAGTVFAGLAGRGEP